MGCCAWTRGALLGLALALTAVGCGGGGSGPQAPAPRPSAPDGGPADAGPLPDAGAPDAGAPDAGGPGSASFLRTLAAPGQDEGTSVALAGDGQLLVASTHFVRLPDFGAGPQPAEGSAALSRFAADGTHLWTHAEVDRRPCGGGEPCITAGLNATAAAAGPGGRSALATLLYEEGPRFGVLLLRETPRLTVLDGSGQVLWTRVLQGPAGGSRVSDLGFDPVGNLYAWGFIRGEGWDFGDGQPRGVALQEASFLASYAPDGALRRVQVFGNARGVSRGFAMALDAQGGVVVTGALTGRLGFGGEELVGNEEGRLDGSVAPRVFVARFAPDGAHRWSRLLAPAQAEVADVAVGPAGIALAGSFEQALPFAGRTLTAPFTEGGATDGFVALLDAEGAERWATGFSSGLEDLAFGVGFSPEGDVWAAGGVWGQAFVGPTPVPAEERDRPRIVLARLRGADGAPQEVSAVLPGVPGPGDLAVDARGVLAMTGGALGGEPGCERGCGGALELFILQRVP